MNAIRPARALAAAMLIALISSAVPARGGQQPAAGIAEMSPAVAIGRAPVVAWNARIARGASRIMAAAPAEAPGQLIAPPGDGNDGAPAATRFGDEEVLVVASRHDRFGSRVWSRVWTTSGWSAIRYLPSPERAAHHPAIAGDRSGAWAVWVSGDLVPGDAPDRLFASFWDGTRWSPAEEIPSAPGAPMVPTIAIGHRGVPTVLWAASDGDDAEIWASQRTSGAWSAPQKLTDNRTPDIQPRAASDDGRMLVAWSRLETTGYVPYAARSRAAGWSRPRRLSRQPGNAPVAIAAASPTVVWTLPPDRDGTAAIVGRELRGGTWEELPRLGQARNARLGATGAAGRVALGWHERGGLRVTEGVSAGSTAWRLGDLRGVSSVSAREFEIELPGTYLGFGDSITEGLVRYDDEISFVDPYTTHLANRIAEFVGSPVIVDNAGLSGELSSEGSNRIAAELAGGPTFVLIMEGANDAANLLTSDVTAANLEFMVQRAIDLDVLPLLATVTPRTEYNFTGTNNERIVEVNDLIRAFAPLYQVQIVEQYEAFFRRPELYSDVLHPSEEGYVYMADIWFGDLKPILKAWLLSEDESEDVARDRALEHSDLRDRSRRSG